MIYNIFYRTSKISVNIKNSDFYSSGLHYYSWLQTNRFYAKAV
jgi:hypothetical protein